jgi:hypothetical protein
VSDDQRVLSAVPCTSQFWIRRRCRHRRRLEVGEDGGGTGVVLQASATLFGSRRFQVPIEVCSLLEKSDKLKKKTKKNYQKLRIFPHCE